MADPFPSGTGSVPFTLAEALIGVRSTTMQIKNIVTNMATAAQAAPVSSDSIATLPGNLKTFSAQLTAYAGILGTNIPYVQAQLNKPTMDVAGSFNAMQAAITNVINWVVSNFPKAADGNLDPYVQLQADGSKTFTTFSVAQLTGFVTQLQALLATID